MADLLESPFPSDIGNTAGSILIVVSAATSFLTAAAGIGGGVALLAVMAVLMPAPALIPVHGVVQLGSNTARTLIMLRDVRTSVLLPFLAGSLVGAGIGGLTVVQLPPAVLKIGVAAFVLWSAWGSPVAAPGRFTILLTGGFSSFLTMFFGATGPFISAMVKTLRLGRLEHVATHSACMVAQHLIKVAAFGLLGFAYGPYLPLIVAMVASGFLGTVIGKRVLVKMQDRNFHRVLSVVLTLLALRLLYDGISILIA